MSLPRPGSTPRSAYICTLIYNAGGEQHNSVMEDISPMKPIIVDPQTTTRAAAFELWMDAPNPMVTLFKTLDVTPLLKASQRQTLKFNMLLCWCIGMAASGIKEFYMLPVGHSLIKNHDLPDSMVIGTSAIIDTEIDGAVGMYSGIFNNPFIIWGRYHKGLFKTTLTLSFQFHHTQMDGAHAGQFLQRLQKSIDSI